MIGTLDRDRAKEMVAAALLSVVPDADVDAVGEDVSLREEFELDSLDFLAFVASLSRRSGLRIDEDDYDRLRSLGGCVDYLTSS